MLKAGAEREKITSAFEEAMAASLERKLKAKFAPPVKEIVSADNPYASGAVRPGEFIYDVSGHMTPPTGQAVDAVPQTVAARMQQAMMSAKLRQRRSSAARKEVNVITEAKKMAVMKRRASLASRMGAEQQSDNVHETISEAMRNAHRRHRQSISKAAEVVEDVGCGEDTPMSEVATKMQMVEVAMAEARRRHRRSIARAVEQLQEPPVGAMLSSSAEVFTPASVASYPGDCPQNARLNISAEVFVPPSMTSYSGECQQNACLSNEWIQQESGNAQCQQGWDTTMSPFQSQINQAVASAYQSHCLNEQQSYADYSNSGGHCNSGWQYSSEPAYGSNSATLLRAKHLPGPAVHAAGFQPRRQRLPGYESVQPS